MTLTIYKPDGTKKIYHHSAELSTDGIAYSDGDIDRIFRDYARLPDFTAVLS